MSNAKARQSDGLEERDLDNLRNSCDEWYLTFDSMAPERTTS